MYLLEIAFFFVIGYIAITISNSLIYAARTKEHLEIVNLELHQIRRDLEMKVDERTLEYKYQAEYFKSLVKNSPFAIVTLDNDQHILDCNEAFETLFGYNQSELLGNDLDAMITSPEVSKDARKLTERVLANQKIQASGLRRRKDGSMVHISVSGVPVLVDRKKIGVLGLYQDISASIEAEKILKESEGRYRSLFEDSPISLWEEDFSEVKQKIDLYKSNGNDDFEDYLHSHPELVSEYLSSIRIINVNQATVSLFKAKDKSDLYAGLDRIIPQRSFSVIASEFVCLARGETNFISEIDQETFNNESIHAIIRFNVAPGYENTWEKVFVSILDITERKKNEQKFEYLSTHDQLTDLVNRTLLMDRLSQAVHRANRNNCKFAVLFIDLDGFKNINDHYGHDAGDSVLIQVSKRLSKELRDTDTVARVGGDEFVLVIENLLDDSSIMGVADKLLKTIALPYKVGKDYCAVTASLGISIYPDDSTNPERLISYADKAMYRGKQLGKNQAALYHQKVKQSVF